LSPHPALNGSVSEEVLGQSIEDQPTKIVAVETSSYGSGKKQSSLAGKRGRRVIPTSAAPITFFVREDADWLKPRRYNNPLEEDLGISTAARSAKRFLTEKGASFFVDIVRGTGLLKAEVETALWELVAAGLITADGFDNIRALIDPMRRAGCGRGHGFRPRDSTGRWSLLYTETGKDRERIIEATCHVLLRRYGIVFRDLLVREANVFGWRELLQQFRLMEDRGETRGGRFVGGFNGEQFALPGALASLRLMRGREPSNQKLVLSASDPLNLMGIILPGDKVAATSGNVFALTL